MTEMNGDKQYVNLGASQARKRLKHFGHGVRKVQSDDRRTTVVALVEAIPNPFESLRGLI